MSKHPRIVTKKLPKSNKKSPAKFRQAPKNTIWYFEGDLAKWLGPIVTSSNFDMREVAIITAIGSNFHYNARAKTNLIKFDRREIVDKVMNDKKFQKSGIKTSSKDVTHILKRLEKSGHVSICCQPRDLYYFTDPTK